jgi:hypothetical protein
MPSSPKELLTLLLTRVGCRYSDSCLRPVSDDLAPAQLMPDTPHIEGVYTPRRAAQLIVEDGYDLTMRRDLVVPYCNLKSCMPVSSKRQIAFRYIETSRRGNRCPRLAILLKRASGIHERDFAPCCPSSLHTPGSDFWVFS